MVTILGGMLKNEGGSPGEEFNLEWKGKPLYMAASPLSERKRVVNKEARIVFLNSTVLVIISVITTVLLEHFYPSKVKVPCNGSKIFSLFIDQHCPTSSILKEHRSFAISTLLMSLN